MKDYPPLPDGLPRVLSASSALTACPDSVCPVLDAPELEQLTGSSDRWIAGRLRRLPLRNEDNEPRRIRDLSAGYAEQGFELRRLGARLLLADGVTSVAEARAAVHQLPPMHIGPSHAGAKGDEEIVLEGIRQRIGRGGHVV